MDEEKFTNEMHKLSNPESKEDVLPEVVLIQKMNQLQKDQALAKANVMKEWVKSYL